MSSSGPTPPSAPNEAQDEPFVATLRSQPSVIRLATEGQPHMTLRVEMPAVWDVVRVEAPPTTPVRAVKRRALEVLYPDYGDADAFIMKLNGAAVRDEDLSVTDAGARDGSIFLLTFRRRRPVRA
jgi:hypothetical protein